MPTHRADLVCACLAVAAAVAPVMALLIATLLP